MSTIKAGIRYNVVILATLALAGCARLVTTSVFDVVVPINTIAIVDPASGAARATKLEIIDIRKQAGMERTTIGDVPMGKITLNPSERDLVRTIVGSRLDAALAKPGVSAPEIVYCGIRAFDVTTPPTLLYWDVVTSIELVLRVRGQDRVASGKAVERTYVYPSREIIQRVTTEALKQVAVELDGAFADLLAGSR